MDQGICPRYRASGVLLWHKAGFDGKHRLEKNIKVERQDNGEEKRMAITVGCDRWEPVGVGNAKISL